MKNWQKNKKNQPVNDETRNLLDTTITNIVQALGSKASVLVFWDENRNQPTHFSAYGLATAFFEEMRPVLEDLTRRLCERYRSAGEDGVDLQSDISFHEGNLHVIALPVQAEGRFIAALCLFQSLHTLGVLQDSPALPPAPSLQITSASPYDYAGYSPDGILPVEQVDLLSRNTQLLRRLVDEKEWWRSIVSLSPDGILIVDRNCKIIGFNPAFARLSGWSVEELRGQDCVEAFNPGGEVALDRCSDLCPLKLHGNLLNQGDRRTEISMTTKNGERRAVELSYSAILSSRGEALGSIVGARDVTARKEAEELQKTFLSVVSHELQTPIAIIKGYAGLLADDPTAIKPEVMQDKLKIIEEESDRLSKLVDNLLYASRIQAGGLELERSQINLDRLINRVVQKMVSVSSQHKIEAQLPDETPVVLGDYDKIQEVLVNLIENAIKYSPHGGHIVVDAVATNEEVIIRVADQGIGIPENERQRVFERFSRMDSRYVRERKGAGLGLYICKAIIEAHGGRIWVEAAEDEQGVPSGSRFCFTLPREVPAQLPVLFSRV